MRGKSGAPFKTMHIKISKECLNRYSRYSLLDWKVKIKKKRKKLEMLRMKYDHRVDIDK